MLIDAPYRRRHCVDDIELLLKTNRYRRLRPTL
jgi:hypothetical protein